MTKKLDLVPESPVKSAMIEDAANGKPPQKRADEPSSPLETAELQEKILNPEVTVIKLVPLTENAEPEQIELPEELSLKAIFRNKIHNCLSYYLSRIQAEIRQSLSGEWILIKPSVLTDLEAMLGVVSGKPAGELKDRLDMVNTVALWEWVQRTFKALNEANAEAKEKDPKK